MSERRSIAQAVDGNDAVRSTEADDTSATGEATLGDIVSSLGTNEESVATEDGVGSKSWSLLGWRSQDILEDTFAGCKCRTLKMARKARV